MIGALLGVLSGQVVLDARPVGALVVVAPPGVAAPPRGALVEGVDHALRDATRLALRSEEQLGLDTTALARCAREDLLGCVGRHVASRADADAVLVLGVAPTAGGRWRCALSILSLREADTRALLAEGLGPDARAAADDALFERSVRIEPEVLDVVSADAVRAWVVGGLPRERAGLLAPPGLLALDVPTPSAGVPAELEVDGRSFALAPGRARVDGLAAGPTRLRFVSADGARAAVTDVALSTRAWTTIVAPTLVGDLTSSDTALGPRAWALGAGVGLAAGGLTLAAITLAARGDVRAVCFTRASADADCVGLGPAPLVVDGARLPALDAADVRAGPPGFALGGALLGAGLTWVALELLARDDGRPLWLDVVLVLGGGAAGAGLGYAVRP